MKILERVEGGIRLLDQTKLPQVEETILCRRLEELCEAIKSLRVRGAPALGVAAAHGVALGATNLQAKDEASLFQGLDGVYAAIGATRPTAVNLFWAIGEMRNAAESARGGGVESVIAALGRRAGEIEADNAARHWALGEAGAELIPDGSSVLHHCNTGALATIDYGSALGVVHAAHRRGRAVHVFVDETRPLLQGARLTCWELNRWGIPFTLITDNMAGHYMKKGAVDLAIVGADRIAANGDVANKVGTYTVAVLAAHHGIPFYVAAPLTTIDFNISSGDEITIEERDPDEVRGFRGNQWAPADSPVGNPAFDVTPAGLVAAIVTEAGVARPPYESSLDSLRRAGAASAV